MREEPIRTLYFSAELKFQAALNVLKPQDTKLG